MTTQQRNTDIDDERPTRLNAEAADKFIEHLSMHDREAQRHRLAIYDRMREACPVGHSVEHGGHTRIPAGSRQATGVAHR